MSSSYDVIADEYYDRDLHPTCNALGTASLMVTRRQLKHVDAFPSLRVVEVGCGRSAVVDFIESANCKPEWLLLTDASTAMLAQSLSHVRNGACAAVADAQHLPLASESVDIVVSSLGDPYNGPDLWAEFGRVLRKSGSVIFTSPSRRWAERYRQREGALIHSSRFLTAGGILLDLPSVIPPMDDLKAWIRAGGLNVEQVDEVSLGDLPSGVSAPKLSGVLHIGETVVFGVRAVK